MPGKRGQATRDELRLGTDISDSPLGQNIPQAAPLAIEAGPGQEPGTSLRQRAQQILADAGNAAVEGKNWILKRSPFKRDDNDNDNPDAIS